MMIVATTRMPVNSAAIIVSVIRTPVDPDMIVKIENTINASMTQIL